MTNHPIDPDRMPGVSSEHPQVEAPADDGTEIITSVPWKTTDVPSPDTTPAYQGGDVSGTNRWSAPVLGMPSGMTVEQAHILAEEQNAAKGSKPE